MELLLMQSPDAEKPLSPKRPKRFWAYFGIAISAAALCVYLFSAPASYPKGETVFTIASGEPLVFVARALEEEQYVRSKLVFSSLVTLFGGEHRISPGDYYFKQGQGVVGIAWQVAHGDHAIDQVKVTVPEGETVAEIAALLAAKLPAFDADAFKAEAAVYEGYLFPETYFFYPTVTASEVVSEMRSMFDRQTAKALAAGSSTGRTKAELVTMASLVEREAHGSDDRSTIAGILYKRLSLGMRLQVDATVAYAVGKSDDSLVKADFSVDSPYNTYTHGGLPPGPIANPGLEALKAAAEPAQTSYLYYLHDKNGSIHYAKTYAEHQKNIDKYLR